MNANQMAQQLKLTLSRVAWPLGSKAVVFGSSVYVFAGTAPTLDDAPPGFPFALVSVGSGTVDPDHPDLISQQFNILVAAQVAGDPYGENALIGGARADVGDSANAGVLEVAERARAAAESLTGADGCPLLVSGTSISPPQTLGDGRHIVMADFVVTGWTTSRAFHTAPQRLRRSAGTLSWDGTACAARFDFQRFRLGYVNGDTPAATPAELAATVYTGPLQEFALTHNVGRIYSVFAEYSSRGSTDPAGVDGVSAGNVTGAYIS